MVDGHDHDGRLRRRDPVTTEGRFVGVGLMIAGVAVIGTWAGIAAAWFMTTEHDKHHDNMDALRKEVRELRRLMENRAGDRG